MKKQELKSPSFKSQPGILFNFRFKMHLYSQRELIQQVFKYNHILGTVLQAENIVIHRTDQVGIKQKVVLIYLQMRYLALLCSRCYFCVFFIYRGRD